MNIVEWFDPTNMEHLKAYKGLQDGEYWPEGLLPEGIEFPCTWSIQITSKIVDVYMKEKLEGPDLLQVCEDALKKMECPAVLIVGALNAGNAQLFDDLEDADVDDRWEACWFGYNKALEKVRECVLSGLVEAIAKAKEIQSE